MITTSKNTVCCAAIADCSNIIISHPTDSEQSGCAGLLLKSILKNIMPYLRGEATATQNMEIVFEELTKLKNSAKHSYALLPTELFASVLKVSENDALVIAMPYLCRVYAEHLSLKKDYTSTEKELLDRLDRLSKALGCINIASIAAQLDFINDCLGAIPPEFVSDDAANELTDSLTSKTEFLTRDIVEEAVYCVFRKMKLSKARDICLVENDVTTLQKLKQDYPDIPDDSYIDDPFFLQKRERAVFVKGLQKYTLETLVLTKEFLDKHGLRFYLTEGTLLGAIRHNGFIPWDDDVDIAMPREDYDKLVKLAEEGKVPSELNFESLENNPKHWVLGAKMQLTRQTPYIQHKVTPLSKCNGPYVDIFPLDYWDKPSGIKAWKTGLKIKIARRLIFIKTGYSKATKKKPERILARIFLKLVRHGFLQKATIKVLKKQYSGSHKYMVNLCSYYPYYNEIFPASFFGEPVYVDFEGHKMPVPCEYDYILKTVYGRNYDTIPPLRVTNMRKHAFDLREDITE